MQQPASSPPLGVILTGGRATRLRPLSNTMPKSLVPLLNRPLIAYGIDLLADAGLSEIVVVVGGDDERTGPAAMDAAPRGVSITVARQPEPRGSGDAVISAGEVLDGRRVVVLAVDAMLQGSLRDQVQRFTEPESEDLVAWLVLHPTDRPREMGIAALEDERIVDLEEKPEEPRSDLALVGVWMLAPPAVERLRTDPVINAKGENDLSATLATMLTEGHRLGGGRFEGRWLDVGSLPGLLTTQAALLDAPALVADGAAVEDSSLGPNVVVGDGARLRGVTLRDALVAPGAQLEHLEAEGVIVTGDGAVVQAETGEVLR